MDKLPIDLSTINMEELNKLPIYTGAYRISDSMGSCCFLDPPGYPTYFIQHIYTKYGNEPDYGPIAVIQNRVIEYAWKEFETWESRQKNHKSLMEKLYIKPDLNHPRTKAWIEQLYTYFHNCYVNDAIGKDARHADKLVIFPVPNYQLKSYSVPYNQKKEYAIKEMRNKRKDSIATQNDIIISKATKIAVPKNHAAFRHIKDRYPNAKPNIKLINHPLENTPNWYERLGEKPTADNCPGEIGWSPIQKHPVDSTRCQVCGWIKESK